MVKARFRGAVVAALVGLVGSLGVAAASPARAAAPLVATAPSSDADLSALSLDGNRTPLMPDFARGTTYYETASAEAASVVVTVSTDDPAATAVVRRAGQTYTVSSGTATVGLVGGRNDLDVVVTAPDGVTTKSYRVVTWNGVAPQPDVVSRQPMTTTVFGGEWFSLALRGAPAGSWPTYCTLRFYVDGDSVSIRQNVWDDVAGVRRVALRLPGHQTPGTFDLTVANDCWLNGVTLKSTTVVPQAVTYTPASTWSVTSADVPATMTSGSVFTLRGPGVSSENDLSPWIEAPDGTIIDSVYWWNHTPDGTAQFYVEYPWGNPGFTPSGPRTLKLGHCPSDPGPDCTVVWSRAITWVAPAPANVSFSPVSGSTAGGTKIRVRGQFLVSGSATPSVTIGGQAATVLRTVYENTDEYSTFDDYTKGLDTIEVQAPPSASPGPKQVVVSNQYGSTTARGTFFAADRPVVTSVAPATVANAGGAVVTLRGTAFGTTGRPTVVIGGVKSPFVTRVSDTVVTAVVPDLTGTTGPVDVQLSSPQGGGVSAAVALTLAAPSAVPVVTSVSPASGKVGDSVTVTGSSFGATGTVGVSVGGTWAKVTGTTATTVTFEIPAVDAPGTADLVVAGPGGSRTRVGGLTVLPEPGITTVSPATVPSYATGAAQRVVLTGAGFGTTGTVKVGSAAAVPYSATGGGTTISGVTVPTSAAGQLTVVVTPAGSTTPLRATVRVTAPTVTYVGPDPYNGRYLPPTQDNGASGLVLGVGADGGQVVRLQGTGFGTAGVVRVDGVTASTTSWSDTAVVLTAPAHATGDVPVTVTPTGSTLAATASLRYVPVTDGPQITTIGSTNDLGHTTRRQFDPQADLDDAFTLTGRHLTGNTASATRVVVSEADGSDAVTLVPSGLTGTSLSFAAPRSFSGGGWKKVTVVTDVGTISFDQGVEYLGAGLSFGISPDTGLCLRTPQAATGGVTHQPAVVTVTNSGTAFGGSGTVTFDGVAAGNVTYSAGSVSFSLADLASDLANPWGAKTIVITPSDSSLPVQRIGFTCWVPVSAATTANGSTSDLTVAAGTSYTVGATTSGFLTPFTATAPSGYQYVSAADYGAHGFTQNVRGGVPVGAGDWYVRVVPGAATWDRTKHWFPADPAAVHVTITGTPLTVTPTSANGASFTYRGQLGDGTGGSPADIGYTLSRSLPAGDRITKVVWEYRNSVCATADPTAGWTVGLPQHVAKDDACGHSDHDTTVAWDVRVRSIEMSSTGTDRSIYYELTLPTLRFTITPKDVTVDSVRADRVWDGTTAATLGDLQLSGVVDGDDVLLDSGAITAAFGDAAPGPNKPVTLSSDLALAGSARADYHLTNPRPTVRGTISKRDAVLALSASPATVLLSSATPVTVTATVTDSRTGNPPDGGAGVPAATLTSTTTDVCTVSGTTVTARAAGTCVVSGRVAASANYNAATAASDSTSTTETVAITVVGAPQTIAVLADDLVVASGDVYDPTVQVTGLFDGDSVDNVHFRYYQGATLLPGAPTDPGTYKIEPYGGTVSVADSSAYTNPGAPRYVTGTLVVTAVPPTITVFSPTSGPVSGGTAVTVTGTRLDTVRTVSVGGVTLRVGQFTVDQAGTTLTFRTPAGVQPGPVDLVLGAGTAEARDVFTYVPDPTTGTPQLDLNLNIEVGAKIVGGRATMKGGGLKAVSHWTLYMHSTPVLLAQGTTNARGAFVAALKMPGKACVKGGLHQLVLTGVAPDGRSVTDSQWLVLDDTCALASKPASRPGAARTKVTVGWFLFDHVSARLDANDKKALDRIATTLRGARVVTIEGYTQTQNQSPASVLANKKLALARAEAAAAYLATKGVTARFVTVGKGPVDPVSTRDQRLNRRVVVSAYY